MGWYHSDDGGLTACGGAVVGWVVLNGADLRQSIEEDFPPQKYNALERELRDHKGFAEMRTRVHVGAAPYIKMLDEYVFGRDSADNCKPIVVCGDSGGGKSALLANWVFGLKKMQKGEYRRRLQFVPGCLLITCLFTIHRG